MCGIAGVYGKKGAAKHVESVERMAAAMVHRGPDESGFFLSPSSICALGHRRLSIIDLSDKGRQPMTAEEGRYTIVCNGEIYNFRELKEDLCQKGDRFRSESDTEVLLRLWEWEGISCLNKLRGMFAFGVWDDKDESLTLARDPLGIKPLYYWMGKDHLIFASEVKALRSIGIASGLDPTGLGLFLRWGSIPAPFTIHPDIKSLPAGCWLRFSRKGVEIEKYWDHSEAIRIRRNGCQEEKGRVKSREEAVVFVRDTLLNSVKAHLVSDVPVGAFLSGGIDSSAVVSLMRQVGQGHISTFSITFDDPALDESRYSRLAARFYETDHHERRLTSDEFFSLKSEFMASVDQPTVDGVNTFLVSRFAHENGFKVVTSGVGGDEFFAGYKGTFQDLPRLVGNLGRIPDFALKGCGHLTNFVANLGVVSPSWFRLGNFLSGELSLSGGYDMWRGLFSPQEIKGLFKDKELGEAVATVETEAFIPKKLNGLSPREKVTVLEASRYLGSQLLPDSDVFSMAHSLELRVPLVDRIVAERLGQLHEDRMFLDPNETPKSLLVEAVGDLPSKLVYRKKMGFTFPLEKWLGMEEWRPKSGLLAEAPCQKVDALFRKGKIHWSRRWALEVLDWFAAQ